MAPDLVDEHVGGHERVRANDQVREHQPLPAASERERAFLARDLEGSEHEEPHAATICDLPPDLNPHVSNRRFPGR